MLKFECICRLGGYMIKLINLKKVYKSKNKEKCIAVNDVSLTLEDKGFVFVLGKSGSGKTTLLSLIGGLDNITSGNIVVDGHSIKNFKYADFSNYRNQIVGYIFQDFHLIDELTIEENIALSLDLQNIKDKDLINKSLADVDLEGYGLRYPKELSGGEKQRIAIARALVKNPKIILADEPTGNLDSKTTTQILNLLQKLSNDRLVLIVSHSISDANKYADRIIELSDGKVINDSIKNPNYCYTYQIQKEELVLPINKKLDTKDISIINENLSSGKIKSIAQTDDVFIKNDKSYNEDYVIEKTKFKSSRFNFLKLLKLSITFLKKDFLKLFIYSFLVAALIIILGLSQLIVNFNSSEVIQKELDNLNQNQLSINKVKPVNPDVVKYDTNRVFNIGENDIQTFFDKGYKGEIYELVNVTLDYGNQSTLSHYHKKIPFNPLATYYDGTRGTLVTTEKYVEEVYGKLEYVELSSDIKDYGIYITDYSADAFCLTKPTLFPDYKSLLGVHKSMDQSEYAYINGIIKTGYKEKHKYVTDTLSDTSINQEKLKELSKTDEFIAYYDDVIQNYSISYSFNPNFKESILNSNSRKWVTMGNSTLSLNGIDCQLPERSWFQLYSQKNKYELCENEVVLNVAIYNECFGTNYNASNLSMFVPHETTMKYYYYYDEMKILKLAEIKLNIVGLDASISYASQDVFTQLLEFNNFTSALYFSDISNVDLILDTATELGFEPNSMVAYSLQTMTKEVGIFSDFFMIIFVGLCICSFIILFSYGIKLIKERKYEIGILKALGIKDRSLLFIFGLQILSLIVLVIVMYVLGSIIFIDLSNKILVKSLMELAPNYIMLDINLLYLKQNYILRNSLLVVIIVIVSFIIPLFNLKFLKPTNIIKAKE